MHLTRYQLRVLECYVEWRDRPPTVARLFTRHWKMYLLQGVFTVAAGGLFLALDHSGGAYLMGGMLIGSLARDLGNFNRTIEAWPVVVETTDWKRVDELLGEENRAGPPS